MKKVLVTWSDGSSVAPAVVSIRCTAIEHSQDEAS